MTNKKTDWMTLDTSAKIYPMIMTRYTQSLFRVSIYLKENIIPEVLNQALIDIMPRFPSFNVRLRAGFFWYFLENHTAKPKIFLDDGIVLKKINPRINNHFLFTVLYYNSRISIEFYHAITDGLGGSEFLKALTYRYLILTGVKLEDTDSIIDINNQADDREFEDSYLANYEHRTFKDFLKKSAGSVKGDNAQRIRGTYYLLPGYGIIEGIMSADKLLELARSKNMSITSYIGAAFLLAVYRNSNMKNIRPLTLFIPINLRGVFNSKSLRNFALFSRAGIRKFEDDKELTLEDFARAIESDLKKDIVKEKLMDKLFIMVYSGRLWFIRLLPLPLKYILFKINKLFMHSISHTAILSNLGKIKIPDSMAPHIDGMSLNINLTKKYPISIGVASAAGKARITLTTLIREKDIIKTFFSILTNDGLELEIQSNLREDNRYVL